MGCDHFFLGEKGITSSAGVSPMRLIRDMTGETRKKLDKVLDRLISDIAGFIFRSTFSTKNGSKCNDIIVHPVYAHRRH